MTVRTVRVTAEGRISVGRDLAGQQFELLVHPDGRIELFPVIVMRRDELPSMVREAVNKMAGGAESSAA